MGSDIPSLFLRRLQKTAGFGTKAVVGKAVIRQAFIRQMPASIRAHLATQPDSVTLESLAMLADRALASEADVEESKPGVAEIKVPNKPENYNNAQQNARPFIPPPNVQQNNAAKVIDTSNAPVFYFHQTFGDKARTCRSPCAFSLNC